MKVLPRREVSIPLLVDEPADHRLQNPDGSILRIIRDRERRTAAATATSPSSAAMATATSNVEPYYCFRVKEKADSNAGNNLIIIPRFDNFDLKHLRLRLWKQFGVRMDKRIFYIDDEGDTVPIDSECEFSAALEIAKSAFLVKTVPLIVGSWTNNIEECECELCCPIKKQTDNNPVSPCKKLNVECTNSKPNNMPTPLAQKPHNEGKAEKKKKEECNDAISSKSSDMSNAVPPPWFEKYMETIKKDMVSQITEEVVTKVTEALNKYFDILAPAALKGLNHSRNQSHFILPKRHPRSSELSEKNQKRMRSQDEEQSSDASIECMEEPSSAKNRSLLKDKLINYEAKINRQASSSKKYKKEYEQFMKQYYAYCQGYRRTKKNLEKNQKKSNEKDELQWMHFICKQFEKDKIFSNSQILPEQLLKKESAADSSNNPSTNDTGKSQEQSNQNPANAKPTRPTEPTERKAAENEARMSCSVTGHQMLDEDRPKGNANSSELDDIDKISFLSCEQGEQEKEEEDDNFEFIQMLSSEDDESVARVSVATAEQQLDDSNRNDSPSFEVLSEPSSPPCSIYINEDHFAASETPSEMYDDLYERHSIFINKVLELNAELEKFTCGEFSVVKEIGKKLDPYETDARCEPSWFPPANDRLFCGRKSDFFVRYVKLVGEARLLNAQWKRHTGSEYSFMVEIRRRLAELETGARFEPPSPPPPPPPPPPPLSSSCAQQQRPNERNDDVRNSHTSYLNMEALRRIHRDSWFYCKYHDDSQPCNLHLPAHCDCSNEYQANSGDITQSFHSHTTSVNDATDIYDGPTPPVTSANVQEATATPGNLPRLSTLPDWIKEADVKHVHAPPQVDTPRRSHRPNGSLSDRWASPGAGKASTGEQSPGTADSVHILPETLVIAATQKEDSTKRRNGAKCDHKKPFSVGNLFI